MTTASTHEIDIRSGRPLPSALRVELCSIRKREGDPGSVDRCFNCVVCNCGSVFGNRSSTGDMIRPRAGNATDERKLHCEQSACEPDGPDD